MSESKVSTTSQNSDGGSSDGNDERWNDNDDEEDNWSKQVETDEPISFIGSDCQQHEQEQHQMQQPALIQPRREEPTMKEKLVERERQRRVESERARWKRQFAMAAHAEDDSNNNGNSPPGIIPSDSMDDNLFLRDQNNSVAGTVGEDTVAPIEQLEDDNDGSNMNYPMERFLKEQQQTTLEDEDNKPAGKKETNQGVVMERFLKEPRTVIGGEESLNASTSSLPREQHHSVGNSLLSAAPSNDTTSNGGSRPSQDSTVESVTDDAQGQSEPRFVLRLTEAEIQEMADIDEASRSNAPPSERDDLSELGELVSDFSGLPHADHPSMSQGTPVTVIESSSSSVVNQIGLTEVSATSSVNGIDAIEGQSLSSNDIALSGSGDVSLTGNPPSDIIRDDDDDEDHVILTPHSQVPTEILPIVAASALSLPQFASGDSEIEVEVGGNIVNRTMRPGMFNYKQNDIHNNKTNLPDRPSQMLPKSKFSPDRILNNDDGVNHIEGFNFDKNNPSSPHSPSIVPDPWSPEFSPHNNITENEKSLLPAFSDYGSTDLHDVETQRLGTVLKSTSADIHRAKAGKNDEEKPLLAGIPNAVSMQNRRRDSSWNSLSSVRNMNDINSLCDSVFSDIRSQSTATRMSISNEATEYLECSVLQRAFPERAFALTVTLILELPTLFFIAGGSDQLCSLIGRTKYTTLLALLPLTSAISGNVGLQASTLTTRAISHHQVRKENYATWLNKEIGAAIYIAICMGTIVGTVAFFMGGKNVPFAFSIFIAQFVGILTAGCTGTLAPLLFTFIFERDSGKWGGPLETAVQDVVGSFAMIVISYQVMSYFGPYDIEQSDMCGVAE